MKKSYDFYADPGHGWLKVKLKELVDLNILDQISPYSYSKKDDVFLEEDCDMGVFIKAKGTQLKFREHYSNKYSKIRNYNRLLFV